MKPNSNGPIEGTNNKIKALKLTTFGITKFVSFKARIKLLNYIFLFLFLRKNAGISKSPCEEFISVVGIELVFFSQDLFI